ncbi:hypothetical protein K490DRAFT_67284 [Saccharata proteae CBS 121410]|uniref:Uncharacterized protein n=1 Tax=Saccharata proteae CBS 121410 TaxID=1314787 RepID=A0A9P4HSQ2_9PEZI|nr:hypothetical protein K490DRAFT_67284 [Saccharata proteae CBS 121410]
MERAGRELQRLGTDYGDDVCFFAGVPSVHAAINAEPPGGQGGIQYGVTNNIAFDNNLADALNFFDDPMHEDYIVLSQHDTVESFEAYLDSVFNIAEQGALYEGEAQETVPIKESNKRKRNEMEDEENDRSAKKVCRAKASTGRKKGCGPNRTL